MKKKFSVFSLENLKMAKAIDNFTKLNIDESSFFVDNYNVPNNIRILRKYRIIWYVIKKVLFYFDFL